VNRAAVLPLHSAGRATLTARRLAPHDWLLFAYLFVWLGLAAAHASSAALPLALVALDLLLFLGALAAARLPERPSRGAVIASATLAVIAMHVSRTVTEAEDRRRARFDLGPTFPPALLETAS
jgi:hypothetical protein